MLDVKENSSWLWVPDSMYRYAETKMQSLRKCKTGIPVHSMIVWTNLPRGNKLMSVVTSLKQIHFTGNWVNYNAVRNLGGTIL